MNSEPLNITPQNTDDMGSRTVSGKTSVKTYLIHHIREYGLLMALIAIMVFFQIVTGGTLLRPVNITNLFLQNSFIIIMALGMLLVIVARSEERRVGKECRSRGAGHHG